MRVLGFMSGTSLDGVDAAILETDGERIHAFGPAVLLPFTDQQRAVLVSETEAVVRADRAGERHVPSRAAEAAAIEAHLAAAASVLNEVSGAIDLVGFHGQTVLHRPERRLTIQLGNPAAIADALGVPVIAHMRQADLDAGGQGAPLVPAYHAALAEGIGVARPVAFLNLGGVANLTWLGQGGDVVAFDTGPANGMIDLLVQSRGVGRYDDGGRLAASGKVDAGALATLLDSDYFTRRGPKALDRYDFPMDAVADLSTPDAAATLTAFTVEALHLASAQLPEAPDLWLVCGGGRHNPTLMRSLRERIGDVRSIDDFGLRGDFVEAEAMAFLAARSVRGLPITFPGTTGVAAPMTGGRRFDPSDSERVAA
ncbi:anhydro-N-acetylmuramic acid kinase [Sphingomonas sp. AR_OL41]|uniref:anhydro-N-acetylmuramic acid kinase n=1 Tax=Sphingomonas sp. AR_OL41 TaxID=3042729 RepID=UPI00248195A8|nr:anhydro-N-acetylmuramic acid kinase [Sphingomonas sp. AR_OL41]MDH7971258.1 anhydro-N-acetylmuramic acid kinase [Sphingomonas sp. AR_OL41]